MIKSIKSKAWSTTCGDGCCYECGDHVTIVDDKGEHHYPYAFDTLTALLDYLGVDRVEYEPEDEDD